jgi:hypothetical protein
MTTNPTGYSQQCRTCNADPEIQTQILDMFNEGNSYEYISTKMFRTFPISPDAISNHIRKHALINVPGPDTTVQPLVGVVKPPVTPPKGWEAQLELDGDTGKVTSTPQTDGKLTDFSSILEEFNIDPEEFEVIGSARISKWQSAGGDWLTSYKFEIQKKTSGEDVDLPALFAEVKANADLRAVTRYSTPAPEKKSNRTLIVPFSDLQAGKVGSRGDSKALIERVMEKKEKLAYYIAEQNCAEAVFLDGGDVVESFENTAQQGFTNDLSIMQQLDLAGTIEQDFITLLAETHDKVIVGGVPSNHGAWRKGKDVLGRPSDDWGLFLLNQIQKAYRLAPEAYGHVEFRYPGEWEKSLNIAVQGLDIGLVHGEDSSLAQMENWWAKQVHGNSPIAESDILITAHYHTLGLKPSGRSRKNGKQKYWIATPTLDNGSDWWANKTGSDSDPGLMAFVIDSEIGFDLQSFTVL